MKYERIEAAKPDPTVQASEGKRPLRVVIAYNEIAAGKRAMRVLTLLGSKLGEPVEFQPLPWSFDLLQDTDWAKVAADDAVNADILILATNNPNVMPQAIKRWVESAISRKEGTTSAIVALFGPEENPDGAGSNRLAAVREAASLAGLEFFAPTPRQVIDETMARIHERSEMLTPVLEGILQHQWTPPKEDRSS